MLEHDGSRQRKSRFRADANRWRLFGWGKTRLANRAGGERLSVLLRFGLPTVPAEASVYALSSRHEGMPVVLTEALEFGVPCVAFDVSPGVREVVTHGKDGLVVAPGNTSRFADALATLMSNADLRREYGRHGHESVQRYAPAAIVDRWEREFRLLDR